jgi:hypothetical protein
MDSLPYVDTVPEEYEQYALALIEDEMQKPNEGGTSHTRARARPLQERAPLVRSEMLALEMERLEKAQRNSPGSSDGDDNDDDGTAATTDRLLLHPAPPSVFDAPPPDGSASADEWRRAVRQAKIEYETERIRSVVLAVEQDEQPALWKEWNAARQLSLERLSSSVLARGREAVEAVNAERQRDQIRAGETLHVLAARYHELVGKLDRIRRATAELSSSPTSTSGPEPAAK